MTPVWAVVFPVTDGDVGVCWVRERKVSAKELAVGALNGTTVPPPPCGAGGVVGAACRRGTPVKGICIVPPFL